jgi:OOP family OmpA-OmpF porin
MRIVFVIIALMVLRLASAQNLVPNPGFEAFYNCPFSWNTSSKDFRIPGWSSASNGTPDHYHSCSHSDCGVPNNWAGHARPHGGEGYAGVYVWGKNGKSYREYIQCQLSEPLKAGQAYRIEFFFKLSSFSKYKSDRIGLLLLDSVLSLTRNKVFRVQPTLSVVQTPKEEGDWDVGRMIYHANGGENHLVIGNFFDDHNTENIRLDYRNVKNSMLASIAYFYVDDVSVTLVDSTAHLDIPGQTASKVSVPNEIYTLKNIQFDFNSDALIPLYFSELDKLVMILNEKPYWNVELVGHTDDVGSEAYNMDLSKNRAINVGEYLQAKGIVPTRITTTGVGKTMLLVNGTDEVARTINRRVEVQFVERRMDQ